MARSLPNRVWYSCMRAALRLVFLLGYRVRSRGREHLPASGGALVLSNHQSHLDPPLIGLTCNRRMNYVARKTLFRFPPLRWLISSLDAIPLDRDGFGITGIKETLKRLKRGEMVLLFPEGTRTTDGEVAPLKPGFCALAKRAGVPLVIVGIDGAFQAWPRHKKMPTSGCIHVQYGRAITPAQIEQLSERELVAEVERRLRACHAEARRHRLACLRSSEAATG